MIPSELKPQVQMEVPYTVLPNITGYKNNMHRQIKITEYFKTKSQIKKEQEKIKEDEDRALRREMHREDKRDRERYGRWF